MKQTMLTAIIILASVGCAKAQVKQPALPNAYYNIKWICVEIDTAKYSSVPEYHALGIVRMNINEITRNSYYDTSQWYYNSTRIKWLALKQYDSSKIIINQDYKP